MQQVQGKLIVFLRYVKPDCASPGLEGQVRSIFPAVTGSEKVTGGLKIRMIIVMAKLIE